MLKNWTGAVDDLAFHYDPSHVHRMSVAGSLDLEDEATAEGGEQGAPGDGAPARQPAPVL